MRGMRASRMKPRGRYRARCAIELSYPHGNDLVGGIESEYVIVLWHQISFLFVRLSAADGRRHLLVPLCGSLPREALPIRT